MLTIGGLGFLLACVFGSYILAGGSLEPLIEAMPFELLTIGGAAIGTFVMSNSMHDVKHTLGGFKKIMGGATFTKPHYVELLSLLFLFARLASTKGPMALEPHIENPKESTAFQKFPRILANHHATDMICDYLRMVGMNADDPHQIEDLMGRELKKTLHEELHGAHALQNMADGLPALGIVAAVLGVIKTMSHINEPPAVLGAMIGGALVGTFLGVFLAYGFVGPFANRVKAVIDEDQHFYNLIREVMVAALHNHAPNICVEVGRQNTPANLRPSYNELEGALRASKQSLAA